MKYKFEIGFVVIKVRFMLFGRRKFIGRKRVVFDFFWYFVVKGGDRFFLFFSFRYRRVRNFDGMMLENKEVFGREMLFLSFLLVLDIMRLEVVILSFVILMCL